MLTRHAQLQQTFFPTHLEIHNDSNLHSHHRAMEGVTSKETHFRVVITSDAFEGKSQLQRHKAVNKLLDEDLKREGGIHALQLRTRTPSEDEKAKATA